MNEQERLLCGKQIEQIITLQIEQVSSYTSYLADIKTAITNNQTTRLNELLEKQQLNPLLIEQTQQQQAELLAEHGFEVSDRGLNSCIQDCTNSSQLKALKSTLTDKLKKLENSLLINSLLVQKSQHRVKQSIRLLSGHDLVNAAPGYSRYGNIENVVDTQNTLAKA